MLNPRFWRDLYHRIRKATPLNKPVRLSFTEILSPKTVTPHNPPYSHIPTPHLQIPLHVPRPSIIRSPFLRILILFTPYTNPVFLDENNTIKLGDFGLSRTLSSHEIAFAQTYVGTPYYMSPEIISSLPYTHASDMWALGCVLYELMTHSPPFTAKTQMGLFQKIKDGTFPPLPRDRMTGARLYSSDIEEVIRYHIPILPSSSFF